MILFAGLLAQVACPFLHLKHLPVLLFGWGYLLLKALELLPVTFFLSKCHIDVLHIASDSSPGPKPFNLPLPFRDKARFVCSYLYNIALDAEVDWNKRYHQVCEQF